MKIAKETPQESVKVAPALVPISGGIPEEVRSHLQRIADAQYEGNIAFVLRMALKDWCITDKKTRVW